jgi:hypothetical protein
MVRRGQVLHLPQYQCVLSCEDILQEYRRTFSGSHVVPRAILLFGVHLDAVVDSKLVLCV